MTKIRILLTTGKYEKIVFFSAMRPYCQQVIYLDI